jgi:hypothetical protein
MKEHKQPELPIYDLPAMDGQSLVDIALQEYGNVEGVADIIEENNLPLNPESIGTLKISNKQNAIKSFLRQKGKKINTGGPPSDLPVDPTTKGIHYKPQHYKIQTYK